jgi:hypothetical protein
VPKAGSKISRVSYRPVEYLLPDSVAAQLQCAAASAPTVTAELAAEMDRRFAIAERYGVSRRRLRNYLEHVRRANSAEPSTHANPDACARHEDDAWRRKANVHHRRQASVAAILDQTFGQLANCNPELWDRRAYLMLVGLVYERLATNEDEISNDELVTLAKILAENRRAEARLNGKPHPPGDESTVPATRRLPDCFADVVRQVYGTSFQPPGEGSGIGD